MKKITNKLYYLINSFPLFLFLFLLKTNVLAQSSGRIGTIDVGFSTTNFNLATVLSFFVKAFFTVAALTALLFLLWGAFAWITSSGEKEKVTKAQEKIQAAVIGIILIVAVLAIVVTLESIVFRQAICFGITCDIKLPELIQPK
jgi:magnesium-transporting ATPase (P-type)